MEIDLDVLQAMFQRAIVRSDIPTLENQELSVDVDLIGWELHFTIRDTHYLNTIVTIKIPIKKKTTFSF